MKNILRSLILGIALIAPHILGADQGIPISQRGPDSAKSKTVFESIGKRQLVKVTIITNIQELIDNKRSDQYQDAKLTVEDGLKAQDQWDIELKARGKYRRMKCEFPPLKIKFNKDELKEAGFAKKNKWKLVTHCVDDQKMSKSALLKEYLAYKMYNNLTEHSLEVRLLNITYVDAVTGESFDRMGFLIESIDELAEEFGGEECECLNADEQQMSAREIAVLDLFQYMIGNNDYSRRTLRNVKLIQLYNSEKLVAVPYDFDFSGFVNASYAVPNPNYDQKSVGDRVFVGSPQTEETQAWAIAFFEEKRGEIEDLLMDEQRLSKRERKSLIKYMDGFYKDLKDPSFKDSWLLKAKASTNNDMPF